MKGLILSAGRGSRLRPITFTRTKQLIPVANKPILFYAIEALRDAGIDDIGIVVAKNGEEVKEAVADGSSFSVKVEYIIQEAPLGIAHAVSIARPFLGESPFVLYLGDNILKGGIKRYVKEFEKGGNRIFLSEVPNPSLFGVAEIREGRVISLVEKPRTPPSNLALVGIYMFRKEIFDAIRELTPSKRGEYEITEAIQILIDRGFQVDFDIVSGWWKDTGGLSDLLEANRLILQDIEGEVNGKIYDSHISEKVVIGKGAEVIRSRIEPFVIIDEGSRIHDSFIGSFTSISKNCIVEGSHIEDSIIMDSCSIKNTGRIEGSLLGKNVEINIERRDFESLKLFLGDNSKIGRL